MCKCVLKMYTKCLDAISDTAGLLHSASVCPVTHKPEMGKRMRRHSSSNRQSKGVAAIKEKDHDGTRAYEVALNPVVLNVGASRS